MHFEPIAIIGQSCVLPGALTPGQLWENVLSGKDLLTEVPAGYWRIDPKLVLAESPENAYDLTWSDRGGYVRGFDTVFDPDGFALPKEEILKCDPLVHWVLHTAREAIRDAGYAQVRNMNAGAVFGNLSYPSHLLQEYAESVWLDSQGAFLDGKARGLVGLEQPDPQNRFMSGLPAHILVKSLNLDVGAFAIDASCASSLYAIKLACDKLHDREADVMLAGGVNRADDLIIHIGFCALQAMSHTGRSRPFHKDADGLVPAEGAGFVVLKRLDDAIKDDDTILGVIRAVGISNDGKGHGLLVPSEEGQVRALMQGYEMSGLSPEEVSLIECHATGTPVGDEIELRSMIKVFDGLKNIPIGTVKSNLGHPITASGVAGLIKVLGAFKAGMRPPTLHVEKPNEKIKDSPFRLLTEAEEWNVKGTRRAAISNFGFGGNNAHLIVEEFQRATYRPHKPVPPPATVDDDIAIVGIGSMIADTTGQNEFSQALFSGRKCLRENDTGELWGETGPFELPLMGLRFFPAALDQTLPQQLLILKSTLEAVQELNAFPRERTGVFVGMGCDTEVTRSGLCWRMRQWVEDWGYSSESDAVKEWVEQTKDAINPARKAPAILGAMPNIVANRLCSQFDFAGQGFTISAEELSGIRGLELGVRALKKNELDVAVIGAVDISCEPVHADAVKKVLDEEKHIPGDAAITLILKRLQDARKDNDKIYAVISEASEHDPKVTLGFGDGHFCLTPVIGHSHVASGLLHIAAAALSCKHRAIPNSVGHRAIPWFVNSNANNGGENERIAKVTIDALGDQSASVWIKEDSGSPQEPFFLSTIPDIYVYSGKDRREVLHNLEQDNRSDNGPARLVLVADDAKQLRGLKKKAKRQLSDEKSGTIEECSGIYFREKPIDGDVGFVFGGATGVYAGMGRELLFAFPEIMEEYYERLGDAGCAYDVIKDDEFTPGVMLWKTSILSMAHARISRGMLGLAPQAVMGFSSGEANALFAMDAWQDLAAMRDEYKTAEVFTHQIAGAFAVARKAWQRGADEPVNWVNFCVLAPEKDVTAAIEAEPLAHIVIINAPDDIVIGGDAQACERVIQKVGRHNAYPLPFSIICHCPEMKEYAEVWRKLHQRKTHSVPGVKFYTGSTHSHYALTEDSVADAISMMSERTFDFPAIIKNAWDDGVRVFIEHGPRDNCSRWIKSILGDKDSLTVAFDRSGTSSIVQLVHVIAQLKCAGIQVNEIPILKKAVPEQETDNKDTGSGFENASRTYYTHPPRVSLASIDLPDLDGVGLADAAEEKTADTPPDSVQPELGPTEQIQTRTQNPAQPQNQTKVQYQTQTMAPPPKLPSVAESAAMMPSQSIPAASGGPAMESIASSEPADFYTPESPTMESVETVGFDSQDGVYQNAMPAGNTENSFVAQVLGVISSQNRYISSAHQDFLEQQARVHQRFLQLRANAVSTLFDAVNGYDTNIFAQSPADQSYQQFDQDAEAQYTSYEHDEEYQTSSTPSYPDVPVNQTIPDSLPDVSDISMSEQSVFEHYSQSETAPCEPPARGICWDAATGTHKPDGEARVDAPMLQCTYHAFSKESIQTFSNGGLYECFGPGFEIALTHSRTPLLTNGNMLLLDHIPHFDTSGGPWGRGYLKVENPLHESAGYFTEEAVMPDAAIYDTCLQALSFFITGLGFTVKKDGWRFELITDEHALERAGQVGVNNSMLIYEVFVEEVIHDLYPTVYADILVTCDGVKIIHIRRLGARIVPDWPLEHWPHLLENYTENRQVAKIGEMEFGYKSLLACAFGKPSDAFGPPGEIFDTGRHIARLPGPPYHFMTRVSYIDATPGAMKVNETIEVEYDIPENEWYFTENGNRTMPFCVLMEVALQPCGWLAVFEGGPATTDQPLYFRNLDGTGTIKQEVLPETGIIRTRTTLTNIARIAGVILVNFDAQCFVGDTLVYDMKTGFGFFPKEALDQQIGLETTDIERQQLHEPCDFRVDLTQEPMKYCGGPLQLPKPMLRMIDRVTGYWPDGGEYGLGRLRAEKTVDPSEWFFKAHFFHDPVQPGSLGVETMVQLLQFYMLHEGMDQGIENPRFEPIAIDNAVTWKYRGQVTPDRKMIYAEVTVVERGRDDNGAFAVAEAWLWADELRIFNVKNMRINIVSGSGTIRDIEPDHSQRIEQMVETQCLQPDELISAALSSALKNYISDIPHVAPNTVQITADGRYAVCDTMPLSLYPVTIGRRNGNIPDVSIGKPVLDFERMLAYSREELGLGPWIGEKFTYGLCRQFTRYLILQDPQSFEEIKGRSVLYLANHQVQVESMLFPMMAQVLSKRRIVSIANSLHQTGWLGPLDEMTYSYPGVDYPRNIIYFDQSDRKSMFDIIGDFKAKIAEEGISVFLHTEGRLGLTCRQPVNVLSSVFIDFAQSANLPIVPVKFAGGLPVEKMEKPLDFPLNYCKQDYYIGRPIMPEMLTALPYSERRKTVLEAINQLGPSYKAEEPFEPDMDFKADVEKWMKEKNRPEVQAVLYKALEKFEADANDEETQSILDAAYQKVNWGNNAKGNWLSGLAYFLYESTM